MAVTAVAALEEAVVPALRFESVYADNFQFVWRVMRSLGVAPASLDDATQEVFIVVYRRLHEFEGRANIRTWLFAIARGIAANVRRAEARRGHLTSLDDTPTPASSATSPEQHVAAAEHAQRLLEMLSQLDDEKREVFVLMDVEGLSAPEVAEALGQNLNTIYSRLRVARSQMQTLITQWRVRHA